MLHTPYTQSKGNASDMMDVMGGQLVETAGNVLALLNELKLTVVVSEHVSAQQAQDAAHTQLLQSTRNMQQQVCDSVDSVLVGLLLYIMLCTTGVTVPPAANPVEPPGVQCGSRTGTACSPDESG